MYPRSKRIFRSIFQPVYKHLKEYLLLSFSDPFITASPDGLGTSAKQVSKPLELDGSAKRGKEGDYTASSAVGKTKGTKMLKITDYHSYKTNKATTLPLIARKINADIILGIKESFQGTMEKSHFQIRSCCLVTWKCLSSGRGNGSRFFSKGYCVYLVERRALLSQATHGKKGGWLQG